MAWNCGLPEIHSTSDGLQMTGVQLIITSTVSDIVTQCSGTKEYMVEGGRECLYSVYVL